MSENTSKFVGLDNRKGKINEANDADFVILNPNEKFLVEENKIFHKHKVTPYAGRELSGVIKKTFLRGKKIFDKQNILSEPFGEVILREKIKS
jgi:allantoinase